MTIQTAAGASISISTVPYAGAETSVGFGGATYTVIGEVTNIPAIGKVYAVIKHNPISTRYTKKVKGSYDTGSFTLEYAVDTTDAGQVLLATATDTDDLYAYKITYNNGAIRYFTAASTSLTEEVGTVDNILKGTTQLEISSEIIRV